MNLLRLLLRTTTDEGARCYVNVEGLVLKREYTTGTRMCGRWVLRNINGEVIDFDLFRTSLEKRNKIKLEGSWGGD